MTAVQVRAYAANAADFTEAAASDLDAGRNIAVTSPAIHAGINSADAVCGARLGQRAAVMITTGCWFRLGRRPRTASKSSATCEGSCHSRPKPSTSPTTSPHPPPQSSRGAQRSIPR